MKAVAYKNTGPIDRKDALLDITLPKPKAEGCDLLVKIHAVSVNPVDTKVRQRQEPEEGGCVILGFSFSRRLDVCRQGRRHAYSWSWGCAGSGIRG